MAFWSDKKLLQNLPTVIFPSDASKIDVSGYKLSVGDQIYVTKDLDSKAEQTVINLSSNSIKEIPAGQFALIRTKEKISIPLNAIGFISVRAKTKFKGLINVSGFHVDPGYSDYLIFSVFNAGPKAIPVKENDDIFLIWFADLNEDNSKAKGDCGFDQGIPSDFIGHLNLQVDSTAALGSKLDGFENEVAQFKRWTYPIIAIIAATVVGIGWWGIQSIYDLKIDAEVSQSQSTDMSKSIEDLRTQYQELRLNLDSQKNLGSQKQTIESINDRLTNIEKKLVSPKSAK